MPPAGTLLREKYNWDGIICTDYAILTTMPWGMEDATMAERVMKTIEAGTDRIENFNKKSRELTCNRVSEHHPLGKFLKSVCGFFVPSGYFPFPQQFLYFRRAGKRKAILVPTL